MLEFTSRNIRTWSILGSCGAFGVAANELAHRDEDFAVVTSDLTYFSGLERLKAAYPEKLYNVGIAEQNMVGVAAGMAKEGMNVFATTYAAFAATRALDQVRINMAYMKLPVKMVGLTAGFSAGILGASHMALEDIAIMRSMPGIIVLSPADCLETVKATMAAAECKSPVYIRLSGNMKMPMVYKEDYDFSIGKSVVCKDGSDITVFATGSMVYESMLAADILEQSGISTRVVNVHTIKPLDKKAVLDGCKSKLIVTVEEHSRIGGLGAAVAEILSEIENKPRQLMLGTEDCYPHAASYDYLLRKSGLKSEIIAERILKILGGKRNE